LLESASIYRFVYMPSLSMLFWSQYVKLAALVLVQ